MANEGITEIDNNYNNTGWSAYLSATDALSFGVNTDRGNLATGGQLLLTVPTAPSRFDTNIYRFQSNGVPGSYLFAGANERDNSINTNYADSFKPEGLAFTAASQPGEDLMALYRFQSNSQGTYLLVGEGERDAILADPNLSGAFTEEGLAFYAYEPGSEEATKYNRLRNVNVPGAYLYVTGDELANIQTNFSETFVDEGVAFEVV